MRLNKTSTVINKEEAQKWLLDKCKELNLETIEQLEEYAHICDDFQLHSDVNLHILAII